MHSIKSHIKLLCLTENCNFQNEDITLDTLIPFCDEKNNDWKCKYNDSLWFNCYAMNYFLTKGELNQVLIRHNTEKLKNKYYYFFLKITS